VRVLGEFLHRSNQGAEKFFGWEELGVVRVVVGVSYRGQGDWARNRRFFVAGLEQFLDKTAARYALFLSQSLVRLLPCLSALLTSYCL
jgi:hypothetical protein